MEDDLFGHHIVGNKFLKGRLNGARSSEAGRHPRLSKTYVSHEMSHLSVAIGGKHHRLGHFRYPDEGLLDVGQFDAKPIQLHLEIETAQTEEPTIRVKIALITGKSSFAECG